MSDPFRLRVVKTLTETLKTITPANGFLTDMADFTDSAGRTSARVFRGRAKFGDGDPKPMISILEDWKSDPPKTGGTGTSFATSKWPLLIQGFLEDDTDNPTDAAYRLSADVVKMLALERKHKKHDMLGFAGRVMDIEIGAPVHRPGGDEVSSIAYFYLPIVLSIMENLSEP